MSLYHSDDPPGKGWNNPNSRPPPREGDNFPVDRDDCPDCGKVFHRGDSKVTYTTQPFTSLPENKVSCPSCFKKISTAGVTDIQFKKHNVPQWHKDWRKRQGLRDPP
ncbi:uncharacterized protein METZ01_LOCUS162125 [marine metagenome]|uniref:Uncharacterized protein n=1 Tax=marine metagenome TaxID=408172 RepID=A0A382B6Y8_9ZZZZ